MAKIFLTEAQLINIVKEDISAVKKDNKKEIFNYRDLTNDAWRELVQDAKDTQRISFDLENDDSTGEKKTFYVKKDLRKGQPIKYEFNVELMEAGGDWEWPVMYFRVEFTHDYFHGKLKKDSPEYTFQKDNMGKKLYKCYVIIPPVVAGNKLIKGDGDKYDWTAYQDSEMSKEEEKLARITDADKRAAWKWIEELLNNLVEGNHEMLDEPSNKSKPQRVDEQNSNEINELSEDEFYKKFVAIHKDVQTKGESKNSILNNGFHRGRNVNAMPFNKYYDGDTGWNPFKPKTGDFVWLLTKDGVFDGPNGYQTVEGYIPDPCDGFFIVDGDKTVYENYLMGCGTSNETKPQRMDEDRTIVTTDDAKKLVDFAKGFIGILSPHQLENNELNNKSSKILKKILDKLNFDYIIGIGEWDGDSDTHEQSYILKKPSEIGERPFLKTLKLIAKKFNQEAFIFGQEGGYTLYFLNGETKPLGSTIEFGDEEYISFNFV